MPKFNELDPNEVILGRGRKNANDSAEYRQHLLKCDAGRIELLPGEKPNDVRRLLRYASKSTAVKIRSSWESKAKNAILWKRTGLPGTSVKK